MNVTLKIEKFELPVKGREGFESPAVTAVLMTRDGSVFCATSFSTKPLIRVKPQGAQLELVEDLELESVLGGDVLAVLAGLRHSTSGDTAVSVLQSGMLPSLLRGFSGKDIRGRTGEDLFQFLLAQDGGMGAALRHSIVQLSEGRIVVRRSKDPGVLWDVAHIGDYIFGVTRSMLWREPYMNTEKRETMRGDLMNNFALHRGPDGTLWMLGHNQRLMRMEVTDVKAKPTPLKLPDPTGLFCSTPSYRDTWMYAVCGESAKTLVRIRRNPVSAEEEIQTVATLERRITSICAIESSVEMAHPSAGGEAAGAASSPEAEQAISASKAPNILLIATEDAEAAKLWALDLVVPEDPEMLPPPPALRELARVDGVTVVNALSVDAFDKEPVVWAGEGRVGWGRKENKAPKLIKISGF
jgi:hypothetical protein